MQQSIFFIELDKIRPNPLQPRTDFDEVQLQELAESIREYGVLQPLVVTRKEKDTVTGVASEYELIAGERRLRAARLVGLRDVPVIIREEPAEQVKLELALVENVQREDLNPLDRARAFKKLNEDFSITHREIGDKIGKSREYVANSIRLLSLPSEVQLAIREGRISEGHARPLLMLAGNLEEQKVLFGDIISRNLTVRDAEKISRGIITHRFSRTYIDPEIKALENKLREVLGGRVSIERRGSGGKISIEFFSDEELNGILTKFTSSSEAKASPEELEEFTI